MSIAKQAKMERRKRRIRAKISGTSQCPRLSVFRSLTHIYAQVIDDENSKTLVSVSDVKMKKGTKTEAAKEVGLEIAKKAKEMKIEKIVFDRSGYQYHGRVKAVAEGAREGGLQF